MGAKLGRYRGRFSSGPFDYYSKLKLNIYSVQFKTIEKYYMKNI